MLPYKEKIILFVGPISSGKTTQRALLKTWLKNRTNRFVFSFTIPPFAFVTHFMLDILRKILILGVKTKVEHVKSGAVAFFERINPDFLKKTIHILVLIDALQLLILTLLIKLLMKFGVLFILEDYVPVNTVEYEVYLKLYKKTDIKSLLPLSVLMRILYSSYKNPIICIYLHANKRERLRRSLRRGYSLVDYSTPHDKVRESLLCKVSKNFCEKTIIVDNTSLDVRSTFQTIIKRLNNEYGFSHALA